MKSIRFNIINVAGRVLQHARQWLIRLGANNPVIDILIYTSEWIAAMALVPTYPVGRTKIATPLGELRPKIVSKGVEGSENQKNDLNPPLKRYFWAKFRKKEKKPLRREGATRGGGGFWASKINRLNP